MPPRKLPRHLVWLESFAAAVEAGSLEAAAGHLGLARSVVSEHLKALEDALAEGAPLLERGPGRRLHLTARGERLYAGTRVALQQLDVKRLRDLASSEATLRVGLNPTLSLTLLGGLAHDAARAGFKPVLTFGSPFELVRQLQTRQVDLALAFTPLPPHRGVATETLLRLPFCVLAGPTAALAATDKRALRVTDLQDQPFVDWLRDDPYGGANAARFAAHRVSVREVARVESFLHLYELLRAFRACAIAPDLRPLQPFPPDIRAWPLREPEPQAVEVVALWPEGEQAPEAARVLDGLRQRFRRAPRR